MAPIHRIAVIQLYVKPLQPAKNFEKAASFIHSAAAQGAHLAVLPEYHLTNWVPTEPKFANLCADWETHLHRYQALAKECSICIVPGSIVRTRTATPASPQTLDNATYFISLDGSILGSYVKKNLWGPTERNYLASGSHTPNWTIDTPLGKVGLLICWDLAFPEAWRELVTQGGKVIILSTLWTRSGASDAGHRHNPSAESLFLECLDGARVREHVRRGIFQHEWAAGQELLRLVAGYGAVCGSAGQAGQLGGGHGGGGPQHADCRGCRGELFIRKDLADADWPYVYWQEKQRFSGREKL